MAPRHHVKPGRQSKHSPISGVGRAARGIRVNQVTAGGTRTPIWSRIAPTEEARVALEQRLSHRVPLGRLGEAEDVARVVLYLASDDARNVTGPRSSSTAA